MLFPAEFAASKSIAKFQGEWYNISLEIYSLMIDCPEKSVITC
jgi:hypothetical protein